MKIDVSEFYNVSIMVYDNNEKVLKKTVLSNITGFRLIIELQHILTDFIEIITIDNKIIIKTYNWLNNDSYTYKIHVKEVSYE